MKKKKNIICIICAMAVIIICVVGVTLMYIAGPYIIENLPHKKTNFKTYEEFSVHKKQYYPDRLPDDATEIKYYYYYAFNIHADAVAFSVKKDDYELMKSEAEEWFKKYVEADIGRNAPQTSITNMGNISNIKYNNGNFQEVSSIKDYYIEYIDGRKEYYDMSMNEDILRNEDYSFLKSLNIGDLSDYLIVGYIYSGDEKDEITQCVLANDNTRRLVYFYYGDYSFSN